MKISIASVAQSVFAIGIFAGVAMQPPARAEPRNEASVPEPHHQGMPILLPFANAKIEAIAKAKGLGPIYVRTKRHAGPSDPPYDHATDHTYRQRDGYYLRGQFPGGNHILIAGSRQERDQGLARGNCEMSHYVVWESKASHVRSIHCRNPGKRTRFFASQNNAPLLGPSEAIEEILSALPDATIP